jgi:hypothetical protein
LHAEGPAGAGAGAGSGALDTADTDADADAGARSRACTGGGVLLLLLQLVLLLLVLVLLLQLVLVLVGLGTDAGGGGLRGGRRGGGLRGLDGSGRDVGRLLRLAGARGRRGDRGGLLLRLEVESRVDQEATGAAGRGQRARLQQMRMRVQRTGTRADGGYWWVRHRVDQAGAVAVRVAGGGGGGSSSSGGGGGGAGIKRTEAGDHKV